MDKGYLRKVKATHDDLFPTDYDKARQQERDNLLEKAGIKHPQLLPPLVSPSKREQ